MTTAEEKIREISEKLVNRIDALKEEGYDDPSILATVRNYLIGVTDGIDFAEEMRDEHQKEMKEFANEWMNNGGYHPEDTDQDIT